MLNTNTAKTYLNLAEVANLPETITRAEAAFYDMTVELADEIPSLQIETNWLGDINIPEFILHAKSYMEGKYYDLPVLKTELTFEADFDELLPYANDMTPDYIFYKQQRDWLRRGCGVIVTVTIQAKLDPDYKQTLYDLEKIESHPEIAYNPGSYETISCKV